MMRPILAVILLLATGVVTADITPEAMALIQAEIRKARQLSPADLDKELKAGNKLVLIDVRQDSERGMLGVITHNDIHIPRGYVEIQAYSAVPDRNASIVVYCGKGFRSAFAANTLTAMGYSNVRNLEGGVRAWIKAGLPTLEPAE